MKVKVILRAPKSQIPLHMTVNDAKYGDRHVSTTLDVVESDEVVQWVSNLDELPDFGQTRMGEISGPNHHVGISANSNNEGESSAMSYKDGFCHSQKHLKSLNNVAHSVRHKYKSICVKDLIPTCNLANFQGDVKDGDNDLTKEQSSGGYDSNNSENGETDFFSKSNTSSGENRIETELATRYEKLFSKDFNDDSLNSGMGAFTRTKYNGREMISNMRSKALFRSVFKSFRNYDYNKRFKSNEDFEYAGLPSKDPGGSDSKNAKLVSDKIQKEIDSTSKVCSIQEDILKTFRNLTTSPYLCSSDAKNCNNTEGSAKQQSSHLISMLPPLSTSKDEKNFPANNRSKKETKSSIPLSSVLNGSNSPSNKAKGRLLSDDLLEAISKLSLESSKMSDAFDSFLNNDIKDLTNSDENLTESILVLLKKLELLHNKIHSSLLNGKMAGISSCFSRTDGFYDQSAKNSSKIPNTSLPLLVNGLSNAKGNVLTVNKRDKCPDRDVSNAILKKNQSLNRIDSKRSLSVPTHEEFIDKHSCHEDELGDDVKYLNNSLNGGDKQRNSTSDLITNNNKNPQSKIGLKPKSSFESFSSHEILRGRTKSRDQNNNNSRTVRDFIAENKQNVLQNARKSSSSLQILSNDKKGSGNQRKKPSQVSMNSNYFNNHRNSVSSLNSRNISFDGYTVGKNSHEMYPSLEVGGPIARMNGDFYKYVPCIQNSCHPCQLKYYQPNYQEKADHGYNYHCFQQNPNGYINDPLNRKKCPFFCNIITT